MSKIKLLILLSSVLVLLSCNTNNTKLLTPDTKYSVAHIDGNYQSLLFKNMLVQKLRSFGFYDNESENIIHISLGGSGRYFGVSAEKVGDRKMQGLNAQMELVGKGKNNIKFLNDINLDSKESMKNYMKKKSTIRKYKGLNIKDINFDELIFIDKSSLIKVNRLQPKIISDLFKIKELDENLIFNMIKHVKTNEDCIISSGTYEVEQYYFGAKTSANVSNTKAEEGIFINQSSEIIEKILDDLLYSKTLNCQTNEQ